MRKFQTECKDDKTRYSMVLSECSYNEACDWLSRELAKFGYEITRTEKHINGLMYIWSTNVRSGKQARMYFYDEERGYLLGE